MGTVFEAEHEVLGVRRALKLFRMDGRNAEFLRKRFLAEGKLLARLDHPRLVRVHDMAFDEASGAPYFTMDLVVGPDGVPVTLADVQRAGGISEDRLAGWYADLREALAAIHANGIVHRDIKPENVLVGPDGRAVLSDFGISRIMDDALRAEIALTRTMATGDTPDARRVLGTIMYLAPELRAGGEPSPASDFWALGMTFFRLLTGLWYEFGGRALDLLAPFNSAWRPLFAALLAMEPTKRSLPPLALSARRSAGRLWKWIAAGVLLAGVLAGTLYVALANGRRHADPAAETQSDGEADVDVTDAFAVPAGMK